jgi:hypothetical protein
MLTGRPEAAATERTGTFCRYSCALLAGVVDHDRQKERVVVGHVVGSIHGQAPFTTEIALRPGIRVLGDERHEEITLADLPANLLIPGIPSVETAFVVPDLKPKAQQGVSEGLCRRPILRGVAQKDGTGRAGGIRGYGHR